MGPFDTAFHQIAAILFAAAVIGALARALRQPLIVAFIAVGVIVGPAALGWVEPTGQIELLAQIGIAILLFIVGLKLDLRIVRVLGPVALATGLGQVFFTSAIGFLIALALGFDPVASLYIAIALTFSSTIIIVKLLTDKRELDDLHGRIAIGFLIVQDIVVVLVMIGLSTFGGTSSGAGFAEQLALVLIKGGAFLAGIGILMRFVLAALLHRLARTEELLVLFAIAWALTLAAIGDILGFSEVVGAFLGGFSLASTPYREAISGRLTSLRDFLLLFFFIELGARLDLAEIGGQLGAAAVFSVFVLIGNPLIVMIIMGAMRYRARVGFLAGLTVAQISEFSLIFAALGVTLGHIGAPELGLITAVGLVTIGTSTYMILNSGALYGRLEPFLGIFERNTLAEVPLDDDEPKPEYVIVGLGRYGGRLVDRLVAAGHEVMGVDFDPRAVIRLTDAGIPARYGDVEDPGLPEHLPLARARWVVSTVPALDAGLSILSSFRRDGLDCRVAVTAHDAETARALREAGADLVLEPFTQAADNALEAIVAT
jgi:Kef-type K+ transport system membrane component KefB